MLFVRPSGSDNVDSAEAASAQPLRELTWGAEGLGYAAVGPVAEDQLRRFAPAAH